MGYSVFTIYIQLEKPEKYRVEDISKSLFSGSIIKDEQDIDSSKDKDKLIRLKYGKNGIAFENFYLGYGMLLTDNRQEILDQFFQFFDFTREQ